MNTTRKLMSGLAMAALTVTLAACAGGGSSGRYADEPTTRYYDENPSSFDSDAYYDPFYHYRGTGEFRPSRKLKPYN